MPINVSLRLPSLAFANAKALTFVCVHGGLGLPRAQFSMLLFRRNSHPLTRGRITAAQPLFTAVRYIFIAQSVLEVTALIALPHTL